MNRVNLQAIFAARSRIAPFVRHTPLESSRESGAHLKLENLQRTGSFKVRGATHKLLRSLGRITWPRVTPEAFSIRSSSRLVTTSRTLR